MGRRACLVVSSRPLGQRQRRPDGRTCSCCSGERRLDGGWQIVVDCERQHSRPGCSSHRGTGEQSCVDNGASWCRAWTWPAAAHWANGAINIAIMSDSDRSSVCQWRSGIKWKRLNIFSPHGSPILLVLPASNIITKFRRVHTLRRR